MIVIIIFCTADAADAALHITYDIIFYLLVLEPKVKLIVKIENIEV